MNKLKNKLRQLVDWLQCRKGGKIELMGESATWAVCPHIFPNEPKVVSGGVGHDISFELELARKYNAEVTLFDPSPTGKQTISEIQMLPKGMKFFELGLAGKNSKIGFAKPQRPEEGSWRTLENEMSAKADCDMFECLDYEAALAISGWNCCDILKLDIEGFEYEFLYSMIGSNNLPSQIAVEMHGFLPGKSLSDSMKLRKFLKKLGYKLVWKRREDHLFLRTKHFDSFPK